MTGRLRRIMAGAVLAGVATVLGGLVAPAPAWAHADLVFAQPAAGQTFQESPTGLLLQFTEPVTVPAGGVRLFGPDGATITTGPSTHRAGDGTSVETPLTGPLGDGVYTVAWRVISADSHPAQGAFTFTVGDGAARPGAATAVPDDTGARVAFAVARWVSFAGLAVLVGAVLFVAWCWPAGARRPAVRALVWGGWATGLVGALAAALTYGPYAAGRSLGDVLDGELLDTTLAAGLGRALAARAALLVAAAPALSWLLRRYPDDPGPRLRRAVTGAVILGAGALAATWTVAGHSVSGRFVPVAVAVDIAHLVAMAAWLGGLATLALALLPARELRAMRRAVPAFSRLALICVGVLVVTGLFQAWRQVQTPAALTQTSYGRLLAAKVVVVCVLVGLGMAARGWVRRHYDARPGARNPAPDPHQLYAFRRRVLAETGLGVVVLAVSAVLMATQPAGAAYAAREQAARQLALQAAAVPGSVPFDAGSGRGLIAFDLQPRRVGATVLHLSILDPTGRPFAVPQAGVELRLPERDIGPLPVELRQAGDGHYLAALSLPLAGAWTATVTVRVSDVDEASVDIPVIVAQ
ncbi:CopD family protein [Luedemannella helvata]|uniref:Copper resistance protein CopC n=1 Tax=Luedemannella helvata TaxID=349315 RepID=A0ABN2JRF5_9ACTN